VAVRPAIAAVPYPDPQAVPGLAEVYAEVGAIGRPVLNLYRIMGHSVDGLRAYIGLSHFVRDRSSLPPRLRELAILQTGLSLSCEYEVHHHVQAARAAGLNEAEIQAIVDGRKAGFSEQELAVLSYARGAAEAHAASADTVASLRRLLTLQQISDLAVTVGMYHMIAAIVLPLQVDIDA